MNYLWAIEYNRILGTASIHACKLDTGQTLTNLHGNRHMRVLLTPNQPAIKTRSVYNNDP